MLDYIALYPNPYSGSFNDEIILGIQDRSIADYAIMVMREFEAIENIRIESIEVIEDQDQVDINNHMVNINFKKKDMSTIEIPKAKYIADGWYGEIIFTIRVQTNLHTKVIKKRLLLPLEHDGFYYNNGKKMKAIWQIVDEATYSQRGRNTLKSRMPIIIYQNKNRLITDVEGTMWHVTSYSYALNGRSRRNPMSKAVKKPKAKFINPVMIYSAKMGLTNTIEFFGMQDIVEVVPSINGLNLDTHLAFELDDVFVTVPTHLFEKYDLVKSFVAMLVACQERRDFRVTMDLLDDQTYWTCRIGMIGSVRNKNLMSFYEKGLTNLYMIERLLDAITQEPLRLPAYYKHNIYFLMYWMITNFDEIRRFTNTDMRSKRIRKNECIVQASLGRKVGENINKFIEKKGRSKLNTMDTLLELFNFSSDIIVAGMRNLNDLLKTDDIVNDMDFLEDIAWTQKGPNSLGESNSKQIPQKYRYLDTSMIGVVDLNVSSNTDVGMSGSFVPFVKLYDGFYFTPEHQPCRNRYEFERALSESGVRLLPATIQTFEDYVAMLDNGQKFYDLLKPLKIEIVEKVPNETDSSSRKTATVEFPTGLTFSEDYDDEEEEDDD